MYKHIAVAFDDSGGSKKALERAADLVAAGQAARLTVLHVSQETEVTAPIPDENIGVPPTVSFPGMDGRVYSADNPSADTLAPATQQIYLNSAEDAINHAKELLEPRGIQADYHILEGNVSQTICEFIDENKIDLIVAGNSGKGGMKRLFLGSVSESLVKNADIDVLVVK
ncbi:universal stress protein [Heyndrickxia acidiproducens]|uniref:universal stress protein n=1 Tax=Heyndrickxia acidiproducens TaxID=1121084 RepID=UPI00037409D8|nr:universal stress protein [Heyndrickxia acidiproducens]